MTAERLTCQEAKARIYENYIRAHHVYGVRERAVSSGRIYQARAVIQRFFPIDRKSAILDLGCGDGLLLCEAAESGFEDLTGVDHSFAMTDIAKRVSQATIVTETIENYVNTHNAKKYDAVVLFDVIEHLDLGDLIDLFEQLRKLLTDGGVVLIHAPNGGAPFGGRILYGDLTHERAFTATSLYQLAQMTGYKSVEVFEDPPGVKGIKSCTRRVVWEIGRALMACLLIAETGRFASPVLTMNLFATFRV